MVTRHPGRRLVQLSEAVRAPYCASGSDAASGPPSSGDERRRQVRAAETRLLYENANVGIVVTVVIAAVLAYAQSAVISRRVTVVWLVYMCLVSAARSLLVREFRRRNPGWEVVALDSDNPES